MTQHEAQLNGFLVNVFNDILRLEDMPDVPGGDIRYASLNYGPLEEFVEMSRQRAAGGKKNGE